MRDVTLPSTLSIADAPDGVIFVDVERTPFISDLQDVDTESHDEYIGPDYLDVLQWVEANPETEERTSTEECDAWRPRPASPGRASARRPPARAAHTRRAPTSRDGDEAGGSGS